MSRFPNRFFLPLFVGGLTLLLPSARSQTPPSSDGPDQVKFLIEALSHPEARIRQNAVRLLSERQEKPYDALLTLLAEKPKFQAASAAVVLNEIASKETPLPDQTRERLYGILSAPETETWRWNITATLLAEEAGIAGDSLKDHVDLWIWGVRHPDPMVQLPSLRALQKIGEAGKPAEEAVADLLNRPRRPLTGLVINQQVVNDGLIGLEQPIPEYDPLTICETLAAIEADPNRYVPPLMSLLHHNSEYVRLDAAAILGQVDAEKLDHYPRPQAAAVLSELAAPTTGKVRVSAVRELGNMGRAAAGELDVLVKLLKDKSGDVRLEAAASLGKMGSAAERALPDLKQALRFAKLDTQDAVETMTQAIEAIEETREIDD